MRDPTKPSDDTWTPCPEGILDELLAGKKAAKRANRIRRLSSLSVVAGLILVAVVWSGLGPDFSSTDVSLSCTQVRELRADYRAGNLSRRMKANVDAHLAHCEGCEKFLDGQAASRSAAHHTAGPLRFDSRPSMLSESSGDTLMAVGWLVAAR